jgi:hypothetical protein
MRILEQTENVLTLQNPARDFWFGNIFLFFSGPPIIILLTMQGGRWFLSSFLVAGLSWLALQQIWASDVVKNCSFNQALDRVTVEFHGLQTKIKDFRLKEIQRVEVRKRAAFYYEVVEVSQLCLVTRYAEAIPLSEEHYSRNNNASASLEDIAGQVREFLSLSGH